MKYIPVIGLEIHIQAKTKSKMFCSCSTDYFGDKPNSHVCPVCLGLPGALPVPNQKAIEQCLKLSLALNCAINQFSKFDRKNYFYPDLPKGYQISQYDLPIGKEGYLEIDVEGDARRIRITRVHMEEDTGKSIHDDKSGKTLLDFNKSGMPLIEVVTEPDFTDVAEITTFAKLLKQTVEYLGVSDAQMQKGQMRFELNISLKSPEASGLPDYKVEVKNIGSISVLEKVVGFEVARQAALLDEGVQMITETRGLKDMTGETVAQRVKESADDYRYFPEPDIPPFRLSDEQIAQIRDAMPELPAARLQRYMSRLGLESQQVEVLVDQPAKGEYIDKLLELESDPSLVADAVKWLVGEVSGLMEKQGVSISDIPVTHTDMLYIVRSLKAHKISGTIAKKVIADLFAGKGKSAEEIVSSQGLEQVQDNSQIEAWVDQAIKDNPEIMANLAKNPNAIKALVGQVMRLSRGQANPQVVDELLRSKLT